MAVDCRARLDRRGRRLYWAGILITMTTTVLDAIAGARHPDPFSVLGPHLEHGHLTVRVCLPAAESVSRCCPMAASRSRRRRAIPAGVFEAAIPGAEDTACTIGLSVTYPGGYVAEIDDPYRFGRVITDYDLYLFGEGNHTRIHDKLGAHPMTLGSTEGVHFAVWAPNATRVSVVGDFNDWDGRVHPMRRLGVSGVWEIFVPVGAARAPLQVRAARARAARS